MSWIKQTLVVVASGSAGFYLGGRWVGQKAMPVSVYEQTPAWVDPVQHTLWIVLIGVLLAVVGWVVLDYRDSTKG